MIVATTVSTAMAGMAEALTTPDALVSRVSVPVDPEASPVLVGAGPAPMVSDSEAGGLSHLQPALTASAWMMAHKESSDGKNEACCAPIEQVMPSDPSLSIALFGLDNTVPGGQMLQPALAFGSTGQPHIVPTVPWMMEHMSKSPAFGSVVPSPSSMVKSSASSTPLMIPSRNIIPTWATPQLMGSPSPVSTIISGSGTGDPS
mmetsp:Transcript_35585/g.72154  ORF Transcript_35585/g.72154 Transcript_35585/m.72154 type:complete len:203 (-) Transcript_35585:311-919(-)